MNTKPEQDAILEAAGFVPHEGPPVGRDYMADIRAALYRCHGLRAWAIALESERPECIAYVEGTTGGLELAPRGNGGLDHPLGSGKGQEHALYLCGVCVGWWECHGWGCRFQPTEDLPYPIGPWIADRCVEWLGDPDNAQEAWGDWDDLTWTAETPEAAESERIGGVLDRAEEYLERWTTVEGAGPWLPPEPHASVQLSMGGDLPERGTIDMRRPDRGVLTIDRLRADGPHVWPETIDVDHVRVFGTDCQCERPVVIMRRVDTGERLKVCGCGLARRDTSGDVDPQEILDVRPEAVALRYEGGGV
jgi:hypothetical protein